MWGYGFKDAYQRIKATYRDVQQAANTALSRGGDTTHHSGSLMLFIGTQKRYWQMCFRGLRGHFHWAGLSSSLGRLFPYAVAELKPPMDSISA